MGELEGLIGVLDGPLATGNDGHAGALGDGPGGVFVAELGHRLGRRADEVDVATAADFVEVSVFGEEAVARVDRLNVADFGGADDVGDA